MTHNLDGCTRLDAKEFEADEELCTSSGKTVDVQTEILPIEAQEDCIRN